MTVSWLLSREVVIALALLGGGLAALAMLLQRRPQVSPARVALINRVAYVCSGASIVLFIIAGFTGKGG